MRCAGLLLTLVLTAWLASGCEDPKEVNAAFAQTKVSWSVFDPGRGDGLRSLSGFDQSQKVVWMPRTQALRATDLAEAPGRLGAVAVSKLGLLLLDDSAGTLQATRPGAQLPLTAYETGGLFLWQQKVFLSLRQEPPAVWPPATLAWWAPGQARLAFYPVPSQVKDPSRQAVSLEPPAEGASVLVLDWKHPEGPGWAFDRTTLFLDNGLETPAPPSSPEREKPPAPEFAALKARLAERLGTDVPTKAAVGSGPLLLFTDAGWVSVGRFGEGKARLYRLPELGVAGHYTGALVLTKGFVLTWETTLRGYVGAAGLVYVPFAVLAP